MTEFISEYIPNINDKETIHSILSLVDAQIETHYHMDKNAAQDDRVCDTAIMKELESVQAENQALKAHLVTQLEEMRMENAELRRNLEVANASSFLVSALKEEI